MKNVSRHTQHPEDASVFDWCEEVSDILKWLQERWFPIAAAWLGMAAFYFFDFVSTYHLPLGLTSPGVITALPLLLAIIAGIELLLTGFVISGAMVLFTPRRQGKKSTIGLINGNSRLGKVLRRRVALYWIIITILLWLIWIVALLLSSMGHNPEINLEVTLPVSWILSIFLATILSARGQKVSLFVKTKATISEPTKKNGKKFLKANTDYLLTSAIGFTLQFVLVFFIIFATTSSLEPSLRGASNLFQWMEFIGISCTVIIAVAVIQLVVLLSAIEITQPEKPLRIALMLATGLLALGAIATPVGGKLAAIPFRMLASGGRNCSIMKWQRDQANTVPSDLRQWGSSLSIPLHIFARVNDLYYVQPASETDGRISMIRSDAVASMDACY